MSAKSELISKLKHNKKTRESYVRAKININLPSQIRALRLRRGMKQEDLAREAEMMQPRISAMERPGATKFNLETLIRLAAAFRVGLIVKFVPFSEMLRSENSFSQDTFDVVKIDDDIEFQREEQPIAQRQEEARSKNFPLMLDQWVGLSGTPPGPDVIATTGNQIMILEAKFGSGKSHLLATEQVNTLRRLLDDKIKQQVKGVVPAANNEPATGSLKVVSEPHLGGI